MWHWTPSRSCLDARQRASPRSSLVHHFVDGLAKGCTVGAVHGFRRIQYSLPCLLRPSPMARPYAVQRGMFCSQLYPPALMICGPQRYLRRSIRETISPMDATTEPRLYFPNPNQSATAASPTPHVPRERLTSDSPRRMLLAPSFPSFFACTTIVIRPPHSTRPNLECRGSSTGSPSMSTELSLTAAEATAGLIPASLTWTSVYTRNICPVFYVSPFHAACKQRVLSSPRPVKPLSYRRALTAFMTYQSSYTV